MRLYVRISLFTFESRYSLKLLSSICKMTHFYFICRRGVAQMCMFGPKFCLTQFIFVNFSLKVEGLLCCIAAVHHLVSHKRFILLLIIKIRLFPLFCPSTHSMVFILIQILCPSVIFLKSRQETSNAQLFIEDVEKQGCKMNFVLTRFVPVPGV